MSLPATPSPTTPSNFSDESEFEESGMAKAMPLFVSSGEIRPRLHLSAKVEFQHSSSLARKESFRGVSMPSN